jgi:hypothetical protein
VLRWDEGDACLVGGNKVLFQAGGVITLGQSPCGQHLYSVNVAGIAMIVCTNCFYGADGFREENEHHVWWKKNSFHVQVTDSLFADA